MIYRILAFATILIFLLAAAAVPASLRSEALQHHCIECHGGSTVGGQLFKIMGRKHPYTGTDDLGRYEITRKEKDRYVFKVPMLRNVTRTAPYLNAGQGFTLEEAVTLMASHQLDRRLTPADRNDLIAFLRTLEGDPPPVEGLR